MAYRDGSGRKIEDIAAHAKSMLEAGRTSRTYCSKREWDTWTETIGPKVAENHSSVLYRHCTIKLRTRGGTPYICHNCILFGPKDKDPLVDKMLVFDFYPDGDLDTLTRMVEADEQESRHGSAAATLRDAKAWRRGRTGSP